MKTLRKIRCSECGEESILYPCQRCLDRKIAERAAERAGWSVP